MSSIADKFDFCLHDIDEIVIASPNKEEHIVQVDKVLQEIVGSGLILDKSNCEFARSRLYFRDHELLKWEIFQDQEKTRQLANILTLKDQKEVRTFLAESKMFSKFIYNYEVYEEILSRISRHNSKWNRGDDEKYEWAFTQIKEGLRLQTFECNVDREKPIDIVFLVSEKSYSAAIMQKYGNKDYRCLALTGKMLQTPLKKISIPELEFYCVNDILTRYAYLLHGKKEVRLQLQHMWAELATNWPYLGEDIHRATLKMREFGATAHTAGPAFHKILEFQ